MENRIIRITKGFLAALWAALLLCLPGCSLRGDKGQEDAISIYLWSTTLMETYAPYIQAQLPDMEIEFVVGNNDLDFYEFLSENGALPDIITNRRLSLNDAYALKDDLMDLSETEAAGSIYMTYLNNYQYSDGTINWLPICGVADSILANKALFDEYGIPLPTDYSSFVSACRAFEERGIRGFACDFAYNYSCMEVLQGLSASALSSLEGRSWRLDYEDPDTGTVGLDTEVWPDVLRRMERFISDVGLTPADADLSFGLMRDSFVGGKAAMIRGTGGDVNWCMAQEHMEEVVFLPYFCPDGESWILTYPSLHVALNRSLEQNEARKQKALRVLDVMLSEEGQNALSQNNGMLSYSKNAELQLAPEMESVEPYIASNHLYIRLASEGFFTASHEVVRKMLRGEYDAEEAYRAFDARLLQDGAEMGGTAVTLDRRISYEFSAEGGNPAASAVANTLRAYYGADLLLSPAYNFTGPVLPADYSQKMLSYMIMPNSCEAYFREMTGREVKELARVLVEGAGGCYAPFNRSTLPVISGGYMEVEEDGHAYTLTRLTVDGREPEDTDVYRVIYLDPSFYYKQNAAYLYPEEGDAAFTVGSMRVRQAWTAYIGEGNAICEPTSYIHLGSKQK